MNWGKFVHHFEQGWGVKLRPFIESPACDAIYAALKKQASEGRKIVPESGDVFRAFRATKYHILRVVLIGDAPYSSLADGRVVADGLAFSCSHTMKEQPALRQLLDAVESDCYGGFNLMMSRYPSLDEWAIEGVLLLNASLTTVAGRPTAHTGLWTPLLHYLIDEVFNPYCPGLIYLLVGEEAAKLAPRIDGRAYVLCCDSPGKGEGPLEHQSIFSEANRVLMENNAAPIDWGRELPF